MMKILIIIVSAFALTLLLFYLALFGPEATYQGDGSFSGPKQYEEYFWHLTFDEINMTKKGKHRFVVGEFPHNVKLRLGFKTPGRIESGDYLKNE